MACWIALRVIFGPYIRLSHTSGLSILIQGSSNSISSMQVFNLDFASELVVLLKGYHLDNSDSNRRVIGVLDSTEGDL